MKRPQAFSLIELSIVILIIGILIAGVTQSSRLVNEYRINNAKTVTHSSAVTSIKDLALWLEPVMDGSITSATNGANPEDSDLVSAWNDYNPQSTQKINLTQATSGTRPTYVKNGINNLPTLSFNNGHYLESTTVPIPNSYKQYTIFLVWQNNNSTGTQVIFHQRGLASCSGGDRAGVYISSGNINSWGCGNGDKLIGAYSTSKPYAAVYRVDNTQANNITFFLNGTKTGPTTPTTPLASLGSSAVAVGWGSDGGSTYYFRGYISEIIVFTRALKDAEISDIRTYLTKKYGFAA